MQCSENGGRHHKNSKVADIRQHPYLIRILVSSFMVVTIILLCCMASDETRGKTN